MNKALNEVRKFSEEKMQLMRGGLRDSLPEDWAVFTFGSYARREASSESDIDYIVVTRDDSVSREEIERLVGAVGETLKRSVEVAPAQGGPFAKHVSVQDMITNLGGEKDGNENITRRLLLLLEGDWLCNQDLFVSVRRHLLEKYVDATPKDHQLSLFLLNDIIRYWRTMTVDYMYKTVENSKPWALRNIKLVFSRKLMYASGLFAVALTVDRQKDEKVALLESLFSCPVLDRMERICGRPGTEKLFEHYGYFIESIGDPSIREKLNDVKRDDHDDSTFRALKNEGHHFTRELLLLFERTFHKTHPIHRSVLF